jgi:hypothetical protein
MGPSMVCDGGGSLEHNVKAHRDYAGAADGASDGAKVCAVVRASPRDRSYSAREGAGRQSRRNTGRSPSSVVIGELIEVCLHRLLVHRVTAGYNLAVVDEVIVARCAIVALGNRSIGAGRVLANLCLVLRHIQASGIGDIEDVERIL